MADVTLEYWRTRLADAVAQYGSLTHPEVVRISTILDEYIVAAQTDGDPPAATPRVVGL